MSLSALFPTAVHISYLLFCWNVLNIVQNYKLCTGCLYLKELLIDDIKLQSCYQKIF